jgi:hypothetical protein
LPRPLVGVRHHGLLRAPHVDQAQDGGHEGL